MQCHYLPGNYLRTRGAATYAWGPYGQLISKTDVAATINYEYSAQRLMNAAKVGGATAANYQYDALGRRVKAVEGETTVVTLHSGNDIVYEVRKARRQEQAQRGDVGTMAVGGPGIPPGEIVVPEPDPGDPPTPLPPNPPKPPPPPPPPAPEYDRTVTCYLVLNGKYLAKMVQENSDPAQTYFLHTDMVGSIRAITDSAGQVVARFEYEPFGLLAMSTGPMASGAHRFTGKPEDGATELYYFGARHYDPRVGRFISRDPVRQELNWYAYVSMNPIAHVDHDGLREAMGADLREERELRQQERLASQVTGAFVNAALDMAESGVR
ncbi:MAG: RHS repeat-associated core domain-containing protein [Clostridia bacterium]|nr:RHS repeat-associated core domain-containing protein [Clostridia bacterium]